MPTPTPTDAQIDAHVEAQNLWESGMDDDDEAEATEPEALGEPASDETPSSAFITKGRAAGYRADDPRIRAFWREEEWADERCDQCLFQMAACDCEPGQVSRTRLPFAHLVSKALDELAMVCLIVWRAQEVCGGGAHREALDSALQKLEDARGELEDLPTWPDEDDDESDDNS